MLTLSHARAKLSSFNPRTEHHGDELVPAADLVFSVDAPNTILNHFSPMLLPALYQRDDAPADLVTDPGTLSLYKFSDIEEFPWKKKGAASMVIHFGVSGLADIALGDCEVDKFRIAPKTGGTVTVRFRVKSKPEESDMGRLCTLIGANVEISVEPIEQLPLKPEPDVKQSPKERAESMFNGPPQGADDGEDEEDESMEVD